MLTVALTKSILLVPRSRKQNPCRQGIVHAKQGNCAFGLSGGMGDHIEQPLGGLELGVHGLLEKSCG
jgi:hypothetical protein